MKKTVLITFVSILVISISTGFFFSRRFRAMQLTINARDLPEHGLIIIKPSQPEFSILAANSFTGATSEQIEALKPLSVLIQNTGNKIAVAYTIVWECTDTNGQKQTYKMEEANSEALTDSEEYFRALPGTNLDTVIRPGTARLISILPLPSSSTPLGGSSYEGERVDANQYVTNEETIQRRTSQLLAKFTDITVSIDGVFFNDGTFVGPNNTDFFELIKAQVDAKHDLRKSISESLRRGKSKSEIFQDIEAETNVSTAHPTSSDPADRYKFFRRLFARQFIQMRKLHGDNRALDIAIGSKNRPDIILQKIN